MEERDPVELFFIGLFKVVKVVFLAFCWCIIVLCVMTKNR